MGLDPIELVMDWEGRFGLTLSDAECANMRTVNQAADLIHARLIAQGNPRTWTRDSFRDSLISRGYAPPDFSAAAGFHRDLSGSEGVDLLKNEDDRLITFENVRQDLGIPGLHDFWLHK